MPAHFANLPSCVPLAGALSLFMQLGAIIILTAEFSFFLHAWLARRNATASGRVLPDHHPDDGPGGGHMPVPDTGAHGSSTAEDPHKVAAKPAMARLLRSMSSLVRQDGRLSNLPHGSASKMEEVDTLPPASPTHHPCPAVSLEVPGTPAPAPTLPPRRPDQEGQGTAAHAGSPV